MEKINRNNMPRPARDYGSYRITTYKKFKLENPDLSITRKQFKVIQYTFFRLLADHIMETGDVVTLPYRLGDFSINKRKPHVYMDKKGEWKQHRNVNWEVWMNEGVIAYHNNYHTNGYLFKWVWWPKSADFKLCKLWSFKIAREHSRKLAKLLKAPHGHHQHLYKEWFK